MMTEEMLAMPYRTQFGSHYHEIYGCHGATIPCDTKGLEPCSDCCAGGGHPDDPDGPGDDVMKDIPLATKIIIKGVNSFQGFEKPDPEPEGMPGHARQAPVEQEHESALQSPVASSAEVVEMGQEGLSDGILAPDGGIDPEEIEDGIKRAEDGIRQQFGYRSELLFGEGYTEAGPVLAHETFVLQNTDILRHLGNGILAGTEASERMLHIADVMDGEAKDESVSAFLDRCYHDSDECTEGTTFFRDTVLPAIKDKTGRDIRHVMWLCDCPEDVIDAYGSIEPITRDDIDEHKVGDVLLSDIGIDGKLWGYEHEIERPDEWW